MIVDICYLLTTSRIHSYQNNSIAIPGEYIKFELREIEPTPNLQYGFRLNLTLFLMKTQVS